MAGPPLPYVYFSAKLVISALQTNPYHVCSTSRHSTLKRFRLEHQSPCGPFILLRTQDQSALFSSQFYPHHHLSVQNGEFIHMYLYLQDFASLCWSTSSPVAVVGCFHTGPVMWGRTYIWRQRTRDVRRAAERAARVEG